MISIREQTYGLNVALYNEFTLEDFHEFERAALECTQKIHRPDMLLDLSMLKDFTIDMAVEQLKFMREHEDDFGRIAIVVNDMWIKLGTRLSSLITQQHPKYFDDAASAQEWLLETRSS
ncbi:MULTISPECIES: STAS/SEC14 domain-containing protein [unclassified Neisseria]|uniref:STAS/SEC14 domain-containing protein n=1 Tax=unclassified Neisseria TaxID=2623750 RepID=UPI002665334F|nr:MULTISPECIES: STAS/SEC14 domain-containing protein [unclassified Neisseria]MDO1508803.1 STAS/SEC14 domain-containing protein [Neisseria sp. MVDL19-042950]MDO1515062.1 STAS/SEC14 domain-containing protein [Neisseria sp. MVDL18-041461]MDO1562422.1 STAS/SEC14 domain-containing protein [Neisseria sp. MVDL20-010259]